MGHMLFFRKLVTKQKLQRNSSCHNVFSKKKNGRLSSVNVVEWIQAGTVSPQIRVVLGIASDLVITLSSIFHEPFPFCSHLR